MANCFLPLEFHNFWATWVRSGAAVEKSIAVPARSLKRSQVKQQYSYKGRPRKSTLGAAQSGEHMHNATHAPNLHLVAKRCSLIPGRANIAHNAFWTRCLFYCSQPQQINIPTDVCTHHSLLNKTETDKSQVIIITPPMSLWIHQNSYLARTHREEGNKATVPLPPPSPKKRLPTQAQTW